MDWLLAFVFGLYQHLLSNIVKHNRATANSARIEVPSVARESGNGQSNRYLDLVKQLADRPEASIVVKEIHG